MGLDHTQEDDGLNQWRAVWFVGVEWGMDHTQDDDGLQYTYPTTHPQGLGGTLVLLSVFKKALPALPLSIGLGVVFYLLTRVLIIPYLDRLLQAPLYV